MKAGFRSYLSMAMRRLRRCVGIVLAAGIGLCGCSAPLPTRGVPPVSTALPEVRGSWLHGLAVEAGADRVDGFRLVSEPTEALRTRLAMIAASERTLDLQYFIWAADDTGQRVLQELLQAADRGVRVRLLLDDLYAGEAEALLQAVGSHPRIQVWYFNPFPGPRGGAFGKVLGSLGDMKRVRHRMHNKLLVADNVFALTGGRNVGDLYLTQRQGWFLDVDLVVVGPIVQELSESFDDYWNSNQSYAGSALWDRVEPQDAAMRLAQLRAAKADVLPAEPLDAPGTLRQLAGGLRQDGCIGRAFTDPVEKSVGTSLEDSSLTIHQRVIQMFSTSRSDVVITSPYFVRGQIGLDRIAVLRERGVRIRVLTNSLATTDEPLAHLVYLRYRHRLLKLGVELYELAPPSQELTARGAIHADRLHAKLAVVDRRYLYIGSMNFTGRSERVNTEVGLILDCPDIAAQVIRLVERAQSYVLVLSPTPLGVQWVRRLPDRDEVWADEPHMSLWRKLKNLLISHFIPEEEI